MPGPFDTPGKRAVRELWNTPVLEYLHRTFGYRFRYMGLPGVDLLDVKLWRRMIEQVIAFEIRAKPNDADPQGRRGIQQLRRNLAKLRGIQSYAYFGSFEEVVIRRKDSEGTEFRQQQVVTLYNLDFCDEIASKIETAEQGHQVWRFEAIRQILRDQKECYDRFRDPNLFIILLTVRDQIDGPKLSDFLSASRSYDTKAYLEECNAINPLPAAGPILGDHSWALKAFIHDIVRQYLSNPHISAVFFPTIKYIGTPVRRQDDTYLPSPMLHSMILCRFEAPESPYPTFLPSSYLTGVASVHASEQSELIWAPEPGETSVCVSSPSPVEWLQDFIPAFLAGSRDGGSC